ncbi:MAG: hypothetical protein R2849_22440 [Thermomicrobiales bacterium]
MTGNWIHLGTRYLNLDNITEVHLQDQHRQAYVFYAGGGALQLDQDDARALEAFLKEQATVIEALPRTIGPSAS